ncbi:VanZ family protein [Cohnella herbarum]|uniref:Teicoplanin resistance protein VanZ n=1 Tax=Cohnella herbarum TaxID=2728023 RepID=A0A7Z2VM28_9BACL|nr:VanZ family protein [Cohnella herbarum]QJD85531.1 teicoplanin resistance protein VanZ [Cohnella herbarum]
MLEFYLFPISYAFYTFPITAALFTLPFLIVQYRRYGYVNKIRGLFLYLFLLYLMNALFLIILPLPDTIHNAPPATGVYTQWIPFHFVLDIAKESGVSLEHPSTYSRLLSEQAFLQVVFNVILMVPFGMFLRYYFRARWFKCLIYSLGLSLFFEITQVTAIYGIFDYPYRLFDVDDLMTNTAGGMLGYILAEWLSSLLPRIDNLDESVDLSKKRVSYTRRALAFLFDWVILLPVIVVLSILRCPYPYLWSIAVYFILIPYLTNGFTFGKWLVRIRLKGTGERIRLSELVIRYGLLYLVAGGVHVAYVLAGTNSYPGLFMMLFTLILFVLDLAVAIHVFRCLFNRNRKLIYEAKSGTEHRITLK